MTLFDNAILVVVALTILFQRRSGGVLCASAFVVTFPPRHEATIVISTRRQPITTTTKLHLFRSVRRKIKQRKAEKGQTGNNGSSSAEAAENVHEDKKEETVVADSVDQEQQATAHTSTQQPTSKKSKREQADLVIIGAGVSGLTAAIRAGQSCHEAKIVVLEAGDNVGGRVKSDTTPDGFVLDVGFAVFIEKYPVAQVLLDYDALDLRPFQPGALVKLPHRRRLQRVADPLRRPRDLIPALLAPIGTLRDKLKFIPLLYHLRKSSIEDLFAEVETTTAEALTNRWKFSTDMQNTFFKPFLEGVYLTDTAHQSSRMFHLVMKMFQQGAAMLPRNGIGTVAQQLADKAKKAGADIRTNQMVTSLRQQQQTDDVIDEDDGGYHTKMPCSYLIETENTCIATPCVIIATDSVVAQQLITQFDGFETVLPAQQHQQQAQRSVGCVYYSFPGSPPVMDPILILNGCGGDQEQQQRNNKEYPINNICFPSAVHPSYAPAGYSLCSVTVLAEALEAYQNNEAGLDQAVRKQLASWFSKGAVKQAILNDWKLQRVYRINKAQPAQLGGPMPANQNGGRPCNMYRGKPLPTNVFVCGDHMATATLNGALESGVMAGETAGRVLQKHATISANKNTNRIPSSASPTAA